MPIALPRFDIGAELGHGAHSVVYRARLDGEPCALKVPRARGSWTRWVYREAVALARVRCPGLPSVLEVGEHEGLPYLAMELVAGETLASRIARRSLDVPEAIAIGDSLLETLEAVHRANLVHRDVKPKNVVLESDGRVRLVDFGFATPIERASESDGMWIGTRGYAAPEQLRAPARVDGRADLYGVGVVLFESLTGHLPAYGDDDLERPLADARVPRGLASVITGLLATSPENRYPDATAARMDVSRVKEGKPARGPFGYARTAVLSPIVGREADLSRFEVLGARAASGDGRVAILRGESGSGKTRLLAQVEAKWAATRRGRVVSVPSRVGDPPLAVLRRILEAFVSDQGRLDDASETASATEVLRTAVEPHLGPFVRVIAPNVGALLGGNDEIGFSAAVFAEGAVELLVRLAKLGGPMLLVIDDLQWTDSASRDVLVRLAHRVAEAPLLLILSVRPEAKASPAMQRLATLDPQRVEVFEPAALDRAEIQALAASHLGALDVEPRLVDLMVTLAGNTPLGCLEVLRAFLDTGALRPRAGRWHLDLERAEHVALPAGAVALLGRRVDELPAATRAVLSSAAVLGSPFSEGILAGVVALSPADLGYAFADARRAGLLQDHVPGKQRFSHDIVREMLERRLPPETKRRVHEQCARELATREDGSLEGRCAIADHFIAATPSSDPTEAFEAMSRAGAVCVDRFANERATHYLDHALAEAKRSGIAPDADFYASAGEAKLRTGALGDSLASFEAALVATSEPLKRATFYGRIAWVHQVAIDTDRAWSALGRAFDAVGVRMPVEGVLSVGETIVRAAQLRIMKRTRVTRAEERARISLLCDLHYQNLRLGVECGKQLRFVQSTFQGLELSESLGLSREQARARGSYGFLLVALGRRATGLAEIARARAAAERLGDPVTVASCVQHTALAACFAGRFDEALVLLAECLDVHGHWLELGEYCGNVANADFIESLRGRAERAWGFLSRAVDRFRRSDATRAVFHAYFAQRVRAGLTTLGRVADPKDPWLAAQLEAAETAPRETKGSFGFVVWGARARVHLDREDLGDSFEDLVDAFDAEGHNPRFSHPLLVEYYIAVAHARVEQALAEPEATRARRLAALARALADLDAAAKLPLFKAHKHLVAAWLAELSGARPRVRAQLAIAEELAIAQTCPWVLSGVARLRAHALLAEGLGDAAREQARIAVALAEEHGAKPRARKLRLELGLPAHEPIEGRPSLASGGSGSTAARRQLSSLLRVAEAGLRDLRPEPQAIAILDELLGDLEAQRATLLFHPDAAARTELIVGRSREGETFFAAEGFREALLRKLLQHASEGVMILADEAAGYASESGIDHERLLGMPLYLADRPVGALVVEREASAPEFGPESHALLDVLSHQVPLALEIARLLVDRERLQSSLQHAQKMEAVGRLAGGVAHDFNNMIAAIRFSLDSLTAHVDRRDDAVQDIEIIAQATQRAMQLTRQLLTFSRHTPQAGPCSVNAVIEGLSPMLQTLVGKEIRVVVVPGRTASNVSAERGGLEQALVNLVVNARDAMSDGGVIRIEVGEVTLPAGAFHGVASGPYVVITVTDSGQGMTEEVIERIFEPFYSTKGEGVGTGLGLTTVYGFVKSCGGHVDVESQVGRGSAFRIYLPKHDGTTKAREAKPRPGRDRALRRRTVLVVDDEVVLVGSIRRILERAGHPVRVATSGEEAIRVVETHGGEIGLAIVDVRMPGMSGPELARRFDALGAEFRVLFITAFSPETVPVREGISAVLLKPFSSPELLRHVELLLEHRAG